MGSSILVGINPRCKDKSPISYFTLDLFVMMVVSFIVPIAIDMVVDEGFELSETSEFQPQCPLRVQTGRFMKVGQAKV